MIVPYGTERNGEKNENVKNKNFRRLCEDLKNPEHSIVCINDNAKTDDFEEKKQTIVDIFEAKFPEKSSFEK